MIHDSGHAFRQAAGRFASGVTVVTTTASAGAYGVTVSSFASLSLNPLLVTVSINRSSQLIEHVRSVQSFAVSVLASHQQQVASYVATSGRRPIGAYFPCFGRAMPRLRVRRCARTLMRYVSSSKSASRLAPKRRPARRSSRSGPHHRVPPDDHFTCTRTGNFLIPLMKLLRTRVTSPFSSIEVSRGISSVNISRISIRANALPMHRCGLPLPKVK